MKHQETPTPPRRKPGRNKGPNKPPTQQGVELDDHARALIWTLAEEGGTQRSIADQMGIAPSTVGRVLASDPVGLEALRARLREAQAGAWKAIQAAATAETLAWIQSLGAVRKKLEKGGDKGVSERVWRSLLAMPRALSAVRHAGESGTRMVQLLTGGATERIDRADSGGDADAEQLVQMAIDAGLVDRLPPALRDYANAKMKGTP